MIYMETSHKENTSAVMTLQCLPEIIRESLQTIIEERNFLPDAEVRVIGSADTNISSSCNVKVSDNQRKLSLFIKYLNCSPGGFSEEGIVYFRNEVVFYGDILKEFGKLAEKPTGKSTSPTFAPGCLDVGSTLRGQPFIIMEDLVAGGYAPLDIKGPFSEERARGVLHQLGRFHAFSFAMREKCPRIFANATSKLSETVFRPESRGTLGKLFIHSIHDVFKLAKQSFPPGSVYVEKLGAFTLNIFDKMIALAEGDKEDSPYKVVTHGDLWPNNILGKLLEPTAKTIENVTFIDYQACRLSSPVHDLQLFLLVALDKTTRDQNRQDFIRHYHTSLCQTLQDLGCDPLMLFPYSALKNQLIKHSQFALAVALAGLPLFLDECSTSTTRQPDSKTDGEVSHVNTLLEFVQGVQTRKSMRCKNKMLEIVMDVVDLGYL